MLWKNEIVLLFVTATRGMSEDIVEYKSVFVEPATVSATFELLRPNGHMTLESVRQSCFMTAARKLPAASSFLLH